MPATDTDKARRSTRVFMRVRVVVAGKNADGRRFARPAKRRDQCARRPDVSEPALNMDAILVVTNPFTQEEQEAASVFLGDATDKGQRVGLEFLTPAPHFGASIRPRRLARPARRRSPELVSPEELCATPCATRTLKSVLVSREFSICCCTCVLKSSGSAILSKDSGVPPVPRTITLP